MKKDYSQIVFDLLEVDRHLYQAHNDSECFPLESYGHFYPEIAKNPDKYIEA